MTHLNSTMLHTHTHLYGAPVALSAHTTITENHILGSNSILNRYCTLVTNAHTMVIDYLTRLPTQTSKA